MNTWTAIQLHNSPHRSQTVRHNLSHPPPTLLSIVTARCEAIMFWTGLVVALVAVMVFKLGVLSVWAKVTSMVLTLLFFAALVWGAVAVWRRLTCRT